MHTKGCCINSFAYNLLHVRPSLKVQFSKALVRHRCLAVDLLANVDQACSLALHGLESSPLLPFGPRPQGVCMTYSPRSMCCSAFTKHSTMQRARAAAHAAISVPGAFANAGSVVGNCWV